MKSMRICVMCFICLGVSFRWKPRKRSPGLSVKFKRVPLFDQIRNYEIKFVSNSICDSCHDKTAKNRTESQVLTRSSWFRQKSDLEIHLWSNFYSGLPFPFDSLSLQILERLGILHPMLNLHISFEVLLGKPGLELVFQSCLNTSSESGLLQQVS